MIDLTGDLKTQPEISLAGTMYRNHITKAQLVDIFIILSNQEGNFGGEGYSLFVVVPFVTIVLSVLCSDYFLNLGSNTLER